MAALSKRAMNDESKEEKKKCNKNQKKPTFPRYNDIIVFFLYLIINVCSNTVILFFIFLSKFSK
jgi:hypothetical protein